MNQWHVVYWLPFDRVVHCLIGCMSLFRLAVVVDVDRFAGFGHSEISHRITAWAIGETAVVTETYYLQWLGCFEVVARLLRNEDCNECLMEDVY